MNWQTGWAVPLEKTAERYDKKTNEHRWEPIKGQKNQGIKSKRGERWQEGRTSKLFVTKAALHLKAIGET